MLLDGDAWQRVLHGFERSSFRLETLSEYRVPQEADRIRSFLEGERLPEDYHSAWMDRVADHVARGRRVQRVHTLVQPLSTYLQFEFMYYGPHSRAGEDIRILDLTERPNPGLPDQDFYLFDDHRVVLMHYTPDGTQISRELLENPDVDLYRHYREIALNEAIPFAEYVKT
ncbi:DUF6879 family protein [Streptosporangium saharense]|uniref:DUF6879 family protein n=1 Tax=Streptosporangium saharense TaxID=1706840 RepID=UPI0036BE679A